MTPIFILQLICCTVTVMLAVQLAMASLQVRWKVRRYEVSRWLLCGAMSVLSIHYMLQMTQGLRAQGADVGAVFNILFYTPIFFTTTLSIINMESKRTIVRRYCLRCTIAYICILFIFAFGVITLQSLHLGNLLYVMLGFFIASMAYFIYATRHEILKRKKRMLEVSGGDLIPYVRYAQASITLLCLTAAFLPIAILFNTLLLYMGPLMLLTIVFFIHSFISLGYYMTPKEDIMSIQYESGDKDTRVEYTEGDGNLKESDILSSDRLKEIEQAINRWCEKGLYKDCDVTIYSLSASLGYPKNEVTEYFKVSGHTNFRTWLSDLRFNEAIRMMKDFPKYNNDAISTECGFSSHTQIYRIFKQKTGMSPSQWRKQFASD